MRRLTALLQAVTSFPYTRIQLVFPSLYFVSLFSLFSQLYVFLTQLLNFFKENDMDWKGKKSGFSSSKCFSSFILFFALNSTSLLAVNNLLKKKIQIENGPWLLGHCCCVAFGMSSKKLRYPIFFTSSVRVDYPSKKGVSY